MFISGNGLPCDIKKQLLFPRGCQSPAYLLEHLSARHQGSPGVGRSHTTLLDNCLLKRQTDQPYDGAQMSSLRRDSV